jgi:PAS domain S-box-containing protein
MKGKTSRRNTAKAPQRREPLPYGSILKHCGSGIAVADSNGNIKFMNSALAEIFGFPASRLTSIPVWARLIFPDAGIRTQSVRDWKRDVEARTPTPYREYEYVRSDGARRWCRFRLSPLTDDIIIVTGEDVTEYKIAEFALSESEIKFRDLSEQSPNMIFINCGGRIVYANMQCERALGYSRAEFYDADFDFTDLIVAEDRDTVRRKFALHMSGREVPPYEYGLVTKQGKWIEAMITTRVLTYEGSPALLGIVTDVSALKRAQANLQKSSNKLRAQAKELRAKNAALREILPQIQGEKLLIKKQVSTNIHKFARPILKKLRSRADASQKQSLDQLESILRDLTAQFGLPATEQTAGLSPRQIEICNLIATGKTTRQIAALLNLSVRTIDTQRTRIREKLGIVNRGVSLTTHLLTRHTGGRQ